MLKKLLPEKSGIYYSIKGSVEKWGDPKWLGIAIWSQLLNIFIEIIGDYRPTSITFSPQKI